MPIVGACGTVVAVMLEDAAEAEPPPDGQAGGTNALLGAFSNPAERDSV